MQSGMGGGVPFSHFRKFTEMDFRTVRFVANFHTRYLCTETYFMHVCMNIVSQTDKGHMLNLD